VARSEHGCDGQGDACNEAKEPAIPQAIRLGVLGIGFGQQVHVPAFRSDPGCEVRAIAASSVERARAAADRLGIAKAYGHWREALHDAEIDAVAIALPAREQQQAVLEAARAGKHVFCEKPAALNLAAAEAMLKAVTEAGVVHAIDFEFPEIDACNKAHQRLQEGTLGRIRHVALQWRVETTAYRRRAGSVSDIGGRAGSVGDRCPSWKLRSAEGGGTLNSLVSHSFHYLEWLFGPIVWLNCRLTPDPSSPTPLPSGERGVIEGARGLGFEPLTSVPSPPEDVGRGGKSDARVDLWLQFAAGFSGTVSLAADAFLGCGHIIEAYGDEGTLVLANRTKDYVNGFELWLGTRKSGALERVATDDRVIDADGRITAVRPIALRFLQAIRSGGSVSPNLTDGVRVQQLIDAARAANCELASRERQRPVQGEPGALAALATGAT
jgi:predicted dehydrogenase